MLFPTDVVFPNCVHKIKSIYYLLLHLYLGTGFHTEQQLCYPSQKPLEVLS